MSISTDTKSTLEVTKVELMLGDLERALQATTLAVMRHRHRQERRNRYYQERDPGRHVLRVERVINEAVAVALDDLTRSIGERIFELSHDVDAMRDVLERVCRRTPKFQGRIGSYVHHHWDGIGEGDQRWRCPDGIQD